MPLMRCGDGGWKYGQSGHCYTGKDAKKKAIKQGVAEQYHGGEKFKGMLEDPEISQAELDEALRDEKYEIRMAVYRAVQAD